MRLVIRGRRRTGAMLGHELRNPLAPIRNAVELLRRIGSKDPTLDGARNMIERQVNHLVRLVDDLLDMARVSSGKIQLQKAQLDLAVVTLPLSGATCGWRRDSQCNRRIAEQRRFQIGPDSGRYE